MGFSFSSADPHAIQSVYMNSNYNRALRAHQQLDHERQRMQAYQAYLDMNRPRQARNGSRSSPDMTMNPNSSPQPIPMQMYAVSQPPPQQLAQPLLHHHHHHHQHLPPNPMPVTHSHPTLPQMFPGYGYLPFAFPINSMIAPQTRFAGQPATDSQPMNQVYFNLLRDSMHQGVHQYHDLDLPLQEESQGVSEERIRECTTEFKFKQNDIADEQEPDQCSICLSKYKLNERVRWEMIPGSDYINFLIVFSPFCFPIRRQLPCQHRFHVSCVDLWLTKSTICPYCRFTLKAERQQRPWQVNNNRISRSFWSQIQVLILIVQFFPINFMMTPYLG